MIVCEDADIAAILPTAMRGTFQNAGQNCCGIERIYVYEKVYERFLDMALANVQQMRQGNPLGDEQVDIGSMIMPMQVRTNQNRISAVHSFNSNSSILCKRLLMTLSRRALAF